MADNICKTNGIEHYAGAEPAWHKFGVTMGRKMTTTEALKESHLDFPVEKQSITLMDGTLINDHFATVRTDTQPPTPLGIVGSRYNVVPNVDAFTFFDNIIATDQAIITSCGALGQGERIFIVAELPEFIEVRKDCIKMFLTLFNSHDGSQTLLSMFTPTKVVCANTWRMAMQDGINRVSIRHTTNAKDKMAQAIQLMEVKSRFMVEFGEIVKTLDKIVIADNRAIRIFEQLFIPADLKKLADGKSQEASTRAKNTVEQVKNYYFHHPHNREMVGSGIGVYSAVTGYFQNVKEYKSDEHKISAILLDGSAYKIQQRAYELVLKS